MKIFMAMASIMLLFTLSWWIWKREVSAIRKLYWPALVLKWIAGIALGIIYSTYYTDSDTFFFFNEAKDWSQIAQTDVWQYFSFLFAKHEGYFLGEERMYFMIKLTSIFSIVSGDHYWIASCWFSFLSFLAAWYLTKTVIRYFPHYTVSAVLAFLFFPSCVFWSSGIIKESLAMAAMFYLSAIFLRVWFNDKVSLLQIFLVLISMWVGWKLKYYYFGLVIPIMLSGWAVKQLGQRLGVRQVGQFIMLFLIMAIGLAGITLFHPNFSLHRLADVVVSNNRLFMELSSPNDVIHFLNLKPTWQSLLLNSPWALFSGLFRPFIWEINSTMQLVYALENLMLFVLVILTFKHIRGVLKTEYSILVALVIFYSVILCVFLALSSPNFGTLTRYRIGFLPYIILLITNHPFIVKPLSKLL